MKKITLQIMLTIATAIITCTTYGQDNVINLASTLGSEGNTLAEDVSTINISSTGVVTYVSDLTADDWIVTSNGVSLDPAKDKNLSIKMKAILVTNTTPGPDYGSVTTFGGIDRAGNGDIGIRGGLNNGIELGEGLMFGFDLTNFTSAVTLQIIGVGAYFVGLGEQVTVVNRADTSKQTTVTSDGVIDVSSLGIYATGGAASLNMLSIFLSNDGGTSGANFRVRSIKFKLIDTSTLSVDNPNSDFAKNFTLSQNPVSDLISIHCKDLNSTDFSAMLVDVNGRVLQSKNSKSISTSNKLLFDASSLAAGLYFVNINSGTLSTTKKIIKN